MSEIPPLPKLSDWLAASETRLRQSSAAMLRDLAEDVAAGRVRLVGTEMAQRTSHRASPWDMTLHFEMPPPQEEVW